MTTDPRRRATAGSTAIPLSPAQRRMWMSVEGRPEDTAFALPFAVDLDGPLDEPRLLATMDRLVLRHPALRATVQNRDGDLVQVIREPEEPFAWWDGGVVPVGDPADADEAVTELARQPFDLTAGPLLRVRLVRCSATHHRLAVVVHHLVFDGWSMEVFVRELAQLYAGDGDLGDDDGYAAAAAAAAGDAADEAAVRWWADRLRGAPVLLELPASRPRPVVGTRQAGRHTVVAPAAVTARLRSVAQGQRVTMLTLVKASCDVVLGQYGNRDVVMGVALFGRDRLETHELIGYLARPVMLRTDLSGDPSFAELLARVRGDVLDASEHPELPIDAVLQRLDVPRDPGYADPFPVLFGYSPTRTPVASGGLTFRLIELAPVTSKAELWFAASDVGEELRIDLHHRTDLLEPEDVARLGARLVAVLAMVADDPAQRLTDLARLTQAESDVAVLATPAQPVVLPGLRDVLDRRAAEQPEAVAVVADGVVTTYAQLQQSAHAVTAALRAAGVRPGDPVALSLGPSPSMPAALAGVLAGGATAVLVDPGAPAFEVGTAQREVGFTVALADRAHSFDTSRVRVLDPAGLPPAAQGELVTSAVPVVIAPSADDPERHPVVLSERVVAEVVSALVAALPRGRVPAVGLTDSTASLASVLQVLVALRTGGSLGRAEVSDVVISDSSRVLVLAEHLRSGDLTLISHGRRIPPAVAQRVPVTTWLHVDGPVEAGWYGVGGDPRSAGTLRPRPGLCAVVVDDRGAPVPPGAIGELMLAGESTAVGYLDAGATAERFVPDLLGLPGRGVRTWRRARVAVDGGVQVLPGAGLRRQGLRVELTDVEDAAALDPLVTQARALTAPDGRLILLVAGAVSAADVLERLRWLLLRHALPDRIAVVAHVPGDDAAAAAAADAAADAAPAACGTSPSDAEAVVAAAWHTVLGRDIGFDENFFDAGGSSLLLIRLRNELNRDLPQPVTLVDLFTHPTIRAMAAAFLDGDSAVAATSAAAAERGRARREARRGRR